MDFKALNLIPQILKAAEDAGYETPSPIQQMAIPPVLQGRDLLGCAQTGTGKTAAFAMPILQNLMQNRGAGRIIRALILTPTRELALQIHESFVNYGKHLPLKSCVIFGGVSQNPQAEQLKRGVDILVATPGRLLDLTSQGIVKLGNIEIFVLDEADRMLDMGFVHDVRRVLKCIPVKRQTLLFSATMPKEIEELAASMLQNPEEVYVTPPATTVELIKQSLYKVDKANKRDLLAHLLKDKSLASALVFTRTKHGADRVVRELSREGIKASAIHGNKSQNARQAALSNFKNGEIGVLVATDIAARGIDISELSHVINYDLPEVPETYVHRIGRTGRAGLNGIAISFCCFDELPLLADIEKTTRQNIPEVTEHNWPMEVFESVKKEPQPRAQKRTATEKAPHGMQQSKPHSKQSSGKRNEKQAPSAKGTARAVIEQLPENDKSNKTRRGGQKHRKDTTAAASPMQQGAAPKKAAVPAQASKPATRNAPSARTAQPPQSRERAFAQNSGAASDKAMQVITKKAPKQKFATFDDFFKANK